MRLLCDRDLEVRPCCLVQAQHHEHGDEPFTRARPRRMQRDGELEVIVEPGEQMHLDDDAFPYLEQFARRGVLPKRAVDPIARRTTVAACPMDPRCHFVQRHGIRTELDRALDLRERFVRAVELHQNRSADRVGACLRCAVTRDAHARPQSAGVIAAFVCFERARKPIVRHRVLQRYSNRFPLGNRVPRGRFGSRHPLARRR